MTEHEEETPPKLRALMWEDTQTVIIDLGSYVVRVVIAVKVLMIFAVGPESAITTAVVAFGYHIFSKDTDWMRQTREETVKRVRHRVIHIHHTYNQRKLHGHR